MQEKTTIKWELEEGGNAFQITRTDAVDDKTGAVLYPGTPHRVPFAAGDPAIPIFEPEMLQEGGWAVMPDLSIVRASRALAYDRATNTNYLAPVQVAVYAPGQATDAVDDADIGHTLKALIMLFWPQDQWPWATTES